MTLGQFLREAVRFAADHTARLLWHQSRSRRHWCGLRTNTMLSMVTFLCPDQLEDALGGIALVMLQMNICQLWFAENSLESCRTPWFCYRLSEWEHRLKLARTRITLALLNTWTVLQESTALSLDNPHCRSGCLVPHNAFGWSARRPSRLCKSPSRSGRRGICMRSACDVCPSLN